MHLFQTLKKQGGFDLIKKMLKTHSCFLSVFELISLGKSNTSLEIIRLSLNLKIKKKLYKKYRKDLELFDSENRMKDLVRQSSNKVWVCWFQGIEQAPILVQKCYRSLKENLINKDVVLITSENMSDYVKFPDYIMEKWKNGQITHTHMTDLLRLELLIKYGGTWIDATVFCSSKEEEIPEYFFNSDLFFYQALKPGKDGHSTYMSSWFMSAKTNNIVLMATRYLCYKYWEQNSSMIDYFILHYFMSMVLDYYPDYWKRITPRDNATPHILLLMLFDEYDESVWMSVKSQTPFHKLTYKFNEENINKKNSYYDRIFNLQE